MNDFDNYEDIGTESLSCQLQNNKEYLLYGINNNKFSYEYVGEMLRYDRDIVLASVKKGYYKLLPPCFSYDEELIQIALQKEFQDIIYVPDELLSDKSFMMSILKIHGCFLENTTDDLRDDKEVVLEAVKYFGLALKDASKRLKEDKEVVLEAVKECAFALNYAADHLKQDIDVVLEALKTYERILKKIRSMK